MKRETLLWIIKEPADLQGNIWEQTMSLAKLYWEACWTEDTRDLFHDSSKNVHDKVPRRPERSVIPRQPYRLSSDPDKFERLLFVPENSCDFKYATRHISDDGAFGLVERFSEIVGTLREVGNKK